MFETGISGPLRARHFLRGDFGEESVPHSHPYRIEWRCRSAGLDENGFSTDIALMQRVFAEAIGEIDDVMLNDLPWFEKRQPSLENLAVFLTIRLRELMGDKAPELPMCIVIWEADDAWASYEEERG